MNAWRNRALVVGAVAGAVLGVLAARLYVRAVEAEAADKGETPRFNPAQAATIGVAVLGVLRQIAALSEGKPPVPAKRRR